VKQQPKLFIAMYFAAEIKPDHDIVTAAVLKDAREIDPTATAETVVKILASEDLMGRPEFWSKNGVAGGGDAVAIILRNIARRQ
jgi:hypothetical protein